MCDWRRFGRAAAFMGFVGLVPTEYSSGGSTHRGHITKAGNAHLRAQLVESAWAYQHRPYVGAEIAKRHEGLPPEVVARAWAAQLRLCGRFRHLAARKNTKSRGRRRGCPRARRVLVGRDGRLSMRSSVGHLGLAGRVTESSTMRRRTAVAGPIPGGTMPRHSRSETSQGQLPADNRHAVPTREHQCGGQPNHCPPAHRRNLGARPPPPIEGHHLGEVGRHHPSVKTVVLASLRALRPDPEAPPSAHS